MAKRKKGSKLGVWIIVGLLFVGLLGFGSAGLVSNARGLAKVGDREITIQGYANALRDEVDAFSQQIGIPVTFAQIEPIGLPQAILNQLVTEKVLDNETERLGLSAGDDRVRAQVVANPRFQNLQGAFDRDAYRFQLERDSVNERTYETSLRDTMARALLQGSVVRGIDTPAAYTDALLAFAGERRTFSWVAITAADLATPVAALDDAAIETYFEANSAAYMSPEVRSLTYAWLTPDMLSDSIEVGDDEIRALYDERIDDFVQQERRLVERLVFPDDAAATAAMARVAAGEVDFDTLVTERGLELSDVDLGDVGIEQLGSAGEATFAAAPGDVVGPFLSNVGPALFRMNAVLAAQETAFDEASDELRTEIATSRARRVIADTGERITDLLAGGARLEDLAANTDMQLGTLDWSEGITEGPAAYDEVRAAIVAAEVGAYPALADLEDGGVFAIRLDAITAPTEQPLDTVRDAVVADATAAATAEQVATLADSYSATLAGGGSFEDLGLTPRTDANMLRRDVVAGTPAGFMDLVFSMAVGVPTSVPGDTGIVLVRLDSVAPYDTEDPTIAAERTGIEERASQGMAEDIYSAFTRVLQNQTSIDIDTRAVEAVHQQLR